jgi:hypothetical protein
VGTPGTPFLNNAEIVLTGDRYSDTIVIDNNLPIGNKAMAVIGTVNLIGRSRPVTWTKLASTAYAGATTLQMSQSVQGAWFAGDQLAIAPTEYDYTQIDEVTIKSVSGSTVTLTSPLKYTHYAGPAGAPGSATHNIKLAASVGLLTRNVVFRGNMSDANDTYGATIFVADINRPNPLSATLPAIHLEGSVNFQYAQLKNCGKGSMQYAAVNIQYGHWIFDQAIPKTNLVNVFEGVSFSDSFNYGIVAVAAKNIYLNNSVIHRTFRSTLSFDVDSTNATITNNMFIGSFRSPDVNSPLITQWVQPQAAVDFAVMPNKLSGNVVSGSYDSAYTIIADDCNAAAFTYSNNEAVSSRIGVFILATGSPLGCLQVDGFTIWKSAHLGIVTVDQFSNVIVSNSILSDNHIGISLNYNKYGMDMSFSRIQNSVIIGASPATQDCAQSMTCLAVSPTDLLGLGCGSVLGDAFRRAGILNPQYMNAAKTCARNGEFAQCIPPNIVTRLCGMPWEKRYGLPSTAVTSFTLSGVTFAGFNGTDCGLESHAIVLNPTQASHTCCYVMF